ncbi:MAG: AraC family transcriptional regulator [Roseibium sp.]
MFVPSNHHKTYVTKADLIDQGDSQPVRWLGPSLTTEDQVLRGAIGFVEIEDGLSVHFSNAEDLHDLKIETDCGPRLSVSVFLEGQVDAHVGDFQVPMPSFNNEQGSWTPIATVFSQNQVEKFVRHASRGVRLKKITISISFDWLFEHIKPTESDYKKYRQFAEVHLANISWVPSAHVITLAEQIIAAPQKSPFQQRLYIAARAYGILEEAFQHFAGDRDLGATGTLGDHDRQKLQAIEHYLRAQRGRLTSAEELARNIGVSANSLQRFLARTYQMSASRFIRKFMLERAREALERDGLPIAEAAYIAGYSSRANFSTAFKREFGLSPKQVT